MKRTTKKITITLLLVSTIFLSFSFQSKFFEVAKQLEIYTTLFKELNLYYVNEINPAEITTRAIKNTLKELDPYTNYYNEQDVEASRIRRAGEYGGIGVSESYAKNGITITRVYKELSADKAGLKAGDIITKVNGESLINLESEQLSTVLKGVPDSHLSVEIERQGIALSKELTREKAVVNPVPFFEMIDAETGYITLTEFTEKASAEVKKAFRDLKKKGMKKLVFDLRSNPGGLLGEAINISNFFLPKGKVIVNTKAKVKKWSNTYKGSNDAIDLEMPIVVLINGRSASASEIVSGALQDYDRAVIMGERSFGKGLVQRYRELTYGTQLKVTISKYYTPSGRCIQELDYANREVNGKVPTFSDSGINEFKTANGRTVFDGGGVLPDVIVGYSDKTNETETLLNSKAIFNFATKYYYRNTQLFDIKNFTFSNKDFQNFKEYLKIDTTFTTSQEKLFKLAYASLEKKGLISKEYNEIKEKLANNKIDQIVKNTDFLKEQITEEIVARYFYEEGVYQYKLKQDKVIAAAVILLKNNQKYQQILLPK
jgi:carboxyl-terminal processing protease